MMSEMNNLLTQDSEINIDNIQLTPADESAILLSALRDTCANEDEYNALVMEGAIEMELYGLIDSAAIVTEAQRNIVKLNKQANFSREESKACFRLAKRANDPHYAKYKKYNDLRKAEREYIYTKYASKGKTEAKAVINNSRRKASSMPSKTGKSIVDKMDKKIAQASK